MVQAADAKTELITALAARHGISTQSRNSFNEYLQKLSGTYGVSSLLFGNQGVSSFACGYGNMTNIFLKTLLYIQ